MNSSNIVGHFEFMVVFAIAFLDVLAVVNRSNDDVLYVQKNNLKQENVLE